MCKKFIIFTIFLASMAVQQAHCKNNNNTLLPPWAQHKNATECFACDSPSSCRKPATVTCDQKSANATRSILAKHFRDVSNVTNTKFECLKTSYSFKNLDVLSIRGCVNAGLSPCSLRPKNISYTQHSCVSCSKGLCNPADTLSSSLTIMMSSVVVLLLKCWYF